ncbi:MAG: biopolymer transporter ExbD [Alphaproteobacteria bacterium]|jgi:biopolymer transport protein ExbD|nr:biopolymer transporter ExbD [Alphaproteobacteria bacterium]
MSSESNGGIQLIEEEETPLNSSINTTPLVDIMLVMLIIFLITVPVVVGTVEVELPEERNQAVITRPENVNLSVDTQGNVYWNQYRLPDEEELMSRLRQAAVIVPQPEVHIRGDQETEYHNVGRVVEAAQKAGIAKIGFITKKPGGGGY